MLDKVRIYLAPLRRLSVLLPKRLANCRAPHHYSPTGVPLRLHWDFVSKCHRHAAWRPRNVELRKVSFRDPTARANFVEPNLELFAIRGRHLARVPVGGSTVPIGSGHLRSSCRSGVRFETELLLPDTYPFGRISGRCRNISASEPSGCESNQWMGAAAAKQVSKEEVWRNFSLCTSPRWVWQLRGQAEPSVGISK